VQVLIIERDRLAAADLGPRQNDGLAIHHQAGRHWRSETADRITKMSALKSGHVRCS